MFLRNLLYLTSPLNVRGLQGVIYTLLYLLHYKVNIPIVYILQVYVLIVEWNNKQKYPIYRRYSSFYDFEVSHSQAVSELPHTCTKAFWCQGHLQQISYVWTRSLSRLLRSAMWNSFVLYFRIFIYCDGSCFENMLDMLNTCW